MTVNKVRGGTQVNIMAADCEFDWDARGIPGETAADILAEFEDFARGVQADMRKIASGCRIETVQNTDAPCLAPTPDNPAADLAKALTGRNAVDVVPYAAEAGQFQEAGFSTVICGPGSIDQAHQANEYISLEQVREGRAFIERLIEHLCR